jgi:xanthine dehydrogenase accessory factor
MRKLNEMIVLIKGGGEVGSAVAHKLVRCNIRVCITENALPSEICRGASFSEAVYDSTKTVEGMTAEKGLPTLEQVYKIWRNEHIPLLIDPEATVKPLLKPDVIINAMMLKRETNARMTDANLVIGIGPGFTAGVDVHLVIESLEGIGLGEVIVQGSAVPAATQGESQSVNTVLYAEDTGLFTTNKNIGDAVLANDPIGALGEKTIVAPVSGVLRGILRDQSKVLTNDALAEIDPKNNKESCFRIREQTRAIAGGVLEAIMMSFNIPDIAQP